MVTTAPEPLRSGVEFARALARHGARPALRAGGDVVTHRELAARVADAAAGLGDVRRLVALRPSPTVDFVVAHLAALAGGHPVLLTDDDALVAAYRAEVVRAGGRWQATGATGPELHPELQLLLSTSGSTGSPKLVRLSAAGIEANTAAIVDYLGLTADDVAVTTLPLGYCYGLSVLHSHLSVGGSVALTDRSVTDPALWEVARDAGATSFAGVPHTFDLLDAAGWPELPSLRYVTQAGGRLAPDRVREVAARGRRAGWDLVVMYGQTEATARMAYLPPHLTEAHPEAIGVPVPGGDLRIDAPDTHGVGELVFAGPNVMLGYANGVADLAHGRDVTELRTGDLARRTGDGLLEITGRVSRFAKLFGQRIDLDRVVDLLGCEGHEVACAEAADGSGELVVAAAGTPDAIAVDLVRVATVDRTGLPAHAVRVVPVDSLPRRDNGKVDQAAVARLSRPAAAPEQHSPEEALTRQYAAVLGRAVTPEDTFVGLGGDSLSYVELSVRLEARLRRLPHDWPTRSVADLARLQHDGPRRGWQWLDTTIVLRALAIVLIVGSHTNLFAVTGGAHVLLAVAGFNLARFLLTGATPRDRGRGLLRAAARIAVPAVIWIGAVATVTGAYGWRNVLLLNDVLGPRTWAEPEFYFWFVEVLVMLLLATAALLLVPGLRWAEQRWPFGFATALLAATLVPVAWAAVTDHTGDVLHSTVFVAWYFVAGWAAARATSWPQRLLVTAVVVVGSVDFFDDTQRTAVVVGGVAVLTWLPTVPWPRLLGGVTGVLASASLYVYLTHWQVYPHLEFRWPLGGLLASLAVGVAAWWLVDRAPGALRRRKAQRRTPAPL
ncbi:AMP-binding protein [Nocardioides panacisoli]|uniref:AMP-binding protein n=1 Tax=Nocardioides panacisoli TaxID=627624 RepID=UPI001C6251A7|nr:AMP-binding protein [Nocardioides panacisoli]QYJ03822.1 AMP-binding protein [Nocardioides panacisoli]